LGLAEYGHEVKRDVAPPARQAVDERRMNCFIFGKQMRVLCFTIRKLGVYICF
jgi:hypothetical protein